jgi:hypothetical protein
MPYRLTVTAWLVAAAVVAAAAPPSAGQPQAPSAEPVGGAAGGRRAFSGIYPHLAVTNGGKSECGIGAVVPWADRLWFLTYPAHDFKGGSDKLYELDAGLNLSARPESVGGTHACRLIHRESNQLIIGPYFIDAGGAIRAVSPAVMPGRLTAVARHLAAAAHKVYFFTMEEGLYEVDVGTLEVKTLHADRNVVGGDLLPGVHGKGAYTGQGRLVVANNGAGGTLAEWDGRGDAGSPASWTIVDRNKYTDVTGPGGIYGSPGPDSPVWAIGWDARSVLLNVRDGGRWTRFRLPKASYTHDADHGWFTEWPRIREAGGGRLLMDMHGMFYDFPRTFRASSAAAVRPVSTFLKMVVDFADWSGRLVAGADDASKFGNPLSGRPQSNLWFGSLDGLSEFGPPAGRGGPWVRDAVKAGEPSEAFLLAGFRQRVVHLAHDNAGPVAFTLEIDERGDGNWVKYATVSVPAGGYAYHVIPSETAGEWIRAKTDVDAGAATAYFHYSCGAHAVNEAMFRGLARADQPGRRSEGILRDGDDADLALRFAAGVVDESGKVAETGLYVVGGDMRLHRTDNAAAEKELRSKSAATRDFDVDGASVIVKEGGKRFRLPRGPDALCGPSASGWRRGIREVVTERSLLNAGGTFYELPRAASGGLAKIRPICTHNRQIYDFASWRGMLVLSGNLAGAAADGHYVPSDDGKVGLWFGNVDDLWQLGAPRGEGGPWRGTAVRAGEPSDPYLMLGYDQKTVSLSHDRQSDVRFTIEVDFLGDGTWHAYKTVAVSSGQTAVHMFPEGYSAHWVRVRADADCSATAWFIYDSADEGAR